MTSSETCVFEQTDLYKVLCDVTESSRTESLKLLKQGCDVTTTDEKGNGYLHLICSNPNIQQWPMGWYLPIFYQLGLYGIDVNVKNSEGNTALHFAVSNDLPLRAVNVLMKLGGDATITNNHNLTPGSLATKTEVSEFLEKMYEGLRPALESGKEEAVEFLLNAWCLPNSRHYPFNDQDISKMNIVEKNKFVHVTLSGDVDQMKTLYHDDLDLDYHDVSHCDEDGKPRPLPLICDVYDLGLIDAVKFIAKKQPCSEVKVWRRGSEAPFYIHVLRSFCKEDLPLVLALLRNVSAESLKWCDVPLMMSLYDRDVEVEVVWKLIKLGAPLSVRDGEGRTWRDRVMIETLSDDPDTRAGKLYYVDQHVLNLVYDSRIKQLRELFVNGYRHLNVPTPQGRTVLSLARKQNAPSDVIHLLDHAAEWQREVRAIQRGILYANYVEVRDRIVPDIADCRDAYGRTFLHLAALYNREYVMKLLLSRDLCLPFIDVQDQEGRTALHYACGIGAGAEEIIHLLTTAGANSEITDLNGHVPSDCALHCSHIASRSRPFLDLDLDLYLLERYMDIRAAIDKGMRDRVTKLVDTMYTDCDINMFHDIKSEWKIAIEYRPLLEVCVIKRQEEISLFLIQNGASIDGVQVPDIDDPSLTVSLGEGAQQRDMYSLVNLIKKQKAAQVYAAKVAAVVRLTTSNQTTADDAQTQNGNPNDVTPRKSSACAVM